MVMNGATVPCSNAAAIGISSPSARRTELPSRDQVVAATNGFGPFGQECARLPTGRAAGCSDTGSWTLASSSSSFGNGSWSRSFALM